MKTPLPLQQHPRFAAALGMLGRPVHKISVAGAAPVVAVRVCGQLLASRAPVWHGAPSGQALANSPLRLINAETAAHAHMRQGGFRQLSTPAHVAELDLTASTLDRLQNMKGKWRNAWRRAQNAPVTIRHAPFCAQSHDWLLRADKAQQKAKRFRSLPHNLIGAYAATGADAAVVFVASHADTPISAMLFLTHAPFATYHLGWNGVQGRALTLHHRLLMVAADHFAQAGFTRLDLGSIQTDHAPGLARFKIGSGAKLRPLGGTWLRLPF
jgi:lipid II:glycine glycyltransferase (peptidoglycan interpeptide bridge formation enzyme)